MSGVRVLVGTHKGAFIITSDGRRKKWNIDGPFFAGWDIYHMNGSSKNPDRLYASQSTDWFGQLIQLFPVSLKCHRLVMQRQSTPHNCEELKPGLQKELWIIN